VKTTKPVPKHIKELRGTDRKDRDGKGITIPPVDYLPDPPDTYTDSQKLIWTSIIKTLSVAKALHEVGIPLIHSFCVQYRIFQDAYESVYPKKGGHKLTIISETKNGNIEKKNPNIDTMNQAHSAMIMIADRFGFTPLSQTKINTNPVEDPGKKKGKFDIK